jgi:hypothetical protein
MPSQSTLLGAAGEHYVMAELLRRGYIAALAPQGVPNADIVVTDIEGSRLCSIQVKTRRDIGSDGGWHMKAKHEGIRGVRLFYCFVDFGRVSSDPPRVLVLRAPASARCSRRRTGNGSRHPVGTSSPTNTALCAASFPITGASIAAPPAHTRRDGSTNIAMPGTFSASNPRRRTKPKAPTPMTRRSDL